MVGLIYEAHVNPNPLSSTKMPLKPSSSSVGNI
jgi:hypothetical protein